MEYAFYREVVRVLKRELPPAYKVTVRRVKMKGLDGYCCLYKKKFYIKINSELSEEMAVECLIHEWSHALCWSHRHDNMTEEEFNIKAHDAVWGVCYSEVYTIYEKFFTSKKD